MDQRDKAKRLAEVLTDLAQGTDIERSSQNNNIRKAVAIIANPQPLIDVLVEVGTLRESRTTVSFAGPNFGGQSVERCYVLQPTHDHDWRVSPHCDPARPSGLMAVVCAKSECSEVRYVPRLESRSKQEWSKYEGEVA